MRALAPLVAALALAAPARAATTVVSAAAPGPTAAFSEVTTTADCRGRTVSGGGTRLDQGAQATLANGIHIDGSLPLDATRWLAAGGSGGAAPSDAQTIAYGVCLDAPLATTVAVAQARGPSGTFQETRATATCPPGTALLSGGARATPGTVGSLKPRASYPSDAAGTPVLDGAAPDSWTAVGLNGGGGDRGNTTLAFAVCAAGAPAVVVAHAQVPGPATASTAAQATAACPPGTSLLGGGASISDTFALPGSQGDHLTGSYPSDAAGTPVGAGPASAWTAATHTGGVDSGALTRTDAWALCAALGGAPPAAVPAPPASAPGTGFRRVLGGSGSDAARAIAVDRDGNTYVTGETASRDFPTTPGAPQRTNRGVPISAFVVKLDPAGRIVYSTYLGGGRYTSGRGIAVDSRGRAYVAGATNSTDFPTRRALQRSYGGGPFDAFVARLTPAGKLDYATFLGDTHYDEANAIAVDGDGRAVVTGRTVSPRFPVAGHLRPRVAGGAFVAKLDATGRRLAYSTVFGGDDRGNHGNAGFAVALDRRGAAYVTGTTNAARFPRVSPFQARLGGGGDAFVLEVGAGRVVYSTFLGGRGEDIGRGIAVTAAGTAYVTGLSDGAPFLARIAPRGRRLVSSRKLGGTGVAVDGRGRVHAAATAIAPAPGGRLHAIDRQGGDVVVSG